MPGKPKNEKKRKELIKECKSIRESIKSLKSLMPDHKKTRELRKISKKFEGIASTWQKLSSFTNESINSDKVKASQLLQSMKVSRKLLNDVQIDKKRIKSQEIILKRKELKLGKSLERIKGLWKGSLSDMESSLKMQRDALSRISQEYFSAMNKIDHEINDVLQNPSVPALNLDQLSPKKSNSKKSSSRKTSNCRSSQEDFISNCSAFSLFADEIPSCRSLSTNNKSVSEKKGLKNNEKIKPKLGSNSNEGKNGKGTEMEAEERDFDENSKAICNADSRSSEGLSEISKQESINENVSLQDIKEALLVLKKANLINNSGNSQLLKIAEMIKDPDNTSNIELILQLIEIENRKSKCPNGKNKAKRPSNPRIKIKKSKVAELVDTSREKFRFSDEKSFNRTLLSNEFLLSPKNYDEGLDFIFSGKEELTDVKLEDLLNVNSLIEDLGLVSADNSLLNLNHSSAVQYDDETSREKEFSNQYDEVPVKISKK